MAGTIVIKGGRVVDGTGEREADVAIDDGAIAAVGADLSGDRKVDAGGCIVAPGLVDLHTHLREPGKEEAETVESVVEPYLVRIGFLGRTPRGRIAMPEAYRHLGVSHPEGAALFDDL